MTVDEIKNIIKTTEKLIEDFESYYPNDNGPRNMIEYSKRVLSNNKSKKEALSNIGYASRYMCHKLPFIFKRGNNVQ